MRNSREKPANIKFQIITVFAAEVLGPVNGPMGTFVFPTGVAVVDGLFLEYWTDDIANGMVDDPVAYIGGTYLTGLGFGDKKRAIGFWNVSAGC
jgi:hypothetical protein